MEAKVWYLTLDWSMIWACIGAVLALLLGMAAYGEKEVIQGKYGDNIRKNKWLKVAYHIVSALVLLSLVSEIGLPVFDFLIQKATILFGFETSFSIEKSEDIAHLLAVLCGLTGGWIVAKVVRYFQIKKT